MTNEEFIDHIALTTLVENLRKVTNPMTLTDANRQAYLAYATGVAMLEQKLKLLKEFADLKARESTDLIHLNLTLRTLHALMGDDIYTIDQLTQCTESHLLRIPNLGRKALNEIKDGLSTKGLKLKEKNA
jgi:DNA-directed RNA polymerase alpha subunit